MAQYFALRTFRGDGAPVSTPVWLAPAGRDGLGERLYAYTPARSWKVRRIRRNPVVEVAPSDFDGRVSPEDGWRRGQARVLTGAELRTAKRAMTAKYGNRFRWFTIVLLLGRPRRRGGPAVGLEIRLEPPHQR